MMDEGGDGLIDDVGEHRGAEGVANLVFEFYSGGWPGTDWVGEVRSEEFDAFGSGFKGGDFGKRFPTGNEGSFLLKMTDDRVEIGVFGDDVEIGIWVSSDQATEFEDENEIQCIAAVDRCLNDAELFRMFLEKQN